MVFADRPWHQLDFPVRICGRGGRAGQLGLRKRPDLHGSILCPPVSTPGTVAGAVAVEPPVTGGRLRERRITLSAWTIPGLPDAGHAGVRECPLLSTGQAKDADTEVQAVDPT